MGEQNTTCSLNGDAFACYRWVTVRPYHGGQIWQLWGYQAQINDAEDPPRGTGGSPRGKQEEACQGPGVDATPGCLRHPLNNGLL